jgi:hypothetical protein
MTIVISFGIEMHFDNNSSNKCPFHFCNLQSVNVYDGNCGLGLGLGYFVSGSLVLLLITKKKI